VTIHAAGEAPQIAPGLAGLLDELRWRGMFHDATAGLQARLASDRPLAAYNGFDPSAPSLHIGHLVPIMGLLHFQRRGGRPVPLVGGGTGMIGDPSGRSAERSLLDRETLEANVVSIRAQLERFLDFTAGPTAALMVNNLDWLGAMSLIEFLRDVGKHFTVPYMLAKDSVQNRLDRGLSFTEFSYMLLQAADYHHLYRAFGVELQMGGADQWGNITAGLELIRRVEGPAPDGEERAHVLCYPLLTLPSGEKFGKTSEGTSVWLDAERTSPYAFYQHWLNTEDTDVGTYLRWFTLLDRPEIEALEAESGARPEARIAQRRLARDVTARVHGEEEAARVERASEAVFGGQISALEPAIKDTLANELPRLKGLSRSSFGTGLTAVQIVTTSGAVRSLSEARRLIQQGGLYVEDQRVTDPELTVEAPKGNALFIRVGKRRYMVIPVED
jgi:tyrosyl-tRNA synthetase